MHARSSPVWRCRARGAEVLIHTRSVLEDALRADSSAGVWAVVDVDFENAFPSMEHEAIDESVDRHVPELKQWSKWCQTHVGDIHLPSGDIHHARRGAEQGDPLGSLQCGVVLADVVHEASSEMQRRKGTEQPGCFSFWYADDGQVVCRPADVDLFLDCLDAAAAKVGATRGEGPDVKSLARLVGHPDALDSFDEAWLTDKVRRTCQIGEPNSPIEVLGAMLGPAHARELQFQSRVHKSRDLHDALAEVADPAAELTLGRLCANVSRVNRLLRVSGTMFSEGALAEHDDASDLFVARTLGGDLPSHAAAQAAMSVKVGGLGFKHAADLAVPATLASLIEARPLVARLFEAMASAGVAVPEPMAVYDVQIERATQLLEDRLSTARAGRVRSMCESAAETARRRLTAMLAGTRADAVGAPVSAGQAGDRLLPEDGADDSEHPASRAAQHPHLQHVLSGLVDRDCHDTFATAFAAEDEAADRGDSHSADRLRLHELQDETTNSEWLWSLDPRSPNSLEPDAYVAAVRLRLGAGFALAPLPCRACKGVLGPTGSHALCCAPGESTKGHNDVRDALFDLARLADATAEKEVLGLLETAPGLRPADVLTTAVSPGLTSALDVGIAAPHAVHAGEDCTESMRVRKRATYARFLPALQAEGVEYRPLVWSCWGREHPDTTAALTQLARQAARRRGLPDHKQLLRKARSQICAAIARRAAGMLQACMPGPR